MIDNNLRFDIHVDYIKKKIQKVIGAMYRGCSLLPVKYRKMFANSLLFPHFDLYTRYPIVARALGLAAAECAREQRNLACNILIILTLPMAGLLKVNFMN